MSKDWADRIAAIDAAWEAEQRRERDVKIDAKIASTMANRAKAAKLAAMHRPPVPGNHTVALRAIHRFTHRVLFEMDAQLQARSGHAQAGIASDEIVNIQIIGEIDAGTELELTSALRANPLAKEVVIFIDSRGGCVDSAENIYCALLSHRGHRTGYVIGACNSAAVSVLMACQSRVATPEATFLIHSTVVDGPQDANALATIFASDLNELTMAKAAGIDKDLFAAMQRSAKPFSAKRALAIGLLTDIVDADEDIADLLPQDQPSTDGKILSFPGSTYEVTTMSGQVIRLPLDGAKVQAVLRGGCFGLPKAYLDEARRLWGISPMREME
jgi:ATP-dependent protease ClpP protease subunit